MTAVYQDCEHPALSRNKNFENFKRRCKFPVMYNKIVLYVQLVYPVHNTYKVIYIPGVRENRCRLH